ncbi:MAG: DUF5361 domain-containing protein [Bifidobacterium scardovii]|jgi:hypothetical protein|uniref:DUF5361 domain-containing protein n=1 Tax=Bifidobacterium scardovii TaxID=158787 RepID=UPI00204C5DE7|nr:DUF5361 domain-containing protein [Bifidobacterium scardovii]MDU2421303.1 DUF5361 domain-containing protein [Bifidobacterium scardovii]DAZ29413.1 MAG TPA: protein of unknown function (DUF5361) [Caudoviricetes sp.]
MLDKSPDTLAADFQHYYGLPLPNLLTGDTRPTLYATLAAKLPEQAMIWRELDPRLAWDTQTYLLATIADALDFLAWTKTKAASRPGARWRGQIHRPGQPPRHEATGGDTVAMEDDQLMAYLAAPRS